MRSGPGYTQRGTNKPTRDKRREEEKGKEAPPIFGPGLETQPARGVRRKPVVLRQEPAYCPCWAAASAVAKGGVRRFCSVSSPCAIHEAEGRRFSQLVCQGLVPFLVRWRPGGKGLALVSVFLVVVRWHSLYWLAALPRLPAPAKDLGAWTGYCVRGQGDGLIPKMSRRIGCTGFTRLV